MPRDLFQKSNAPEEVKSPEQMSEEQTEERSSMMASPSPSTQTVKQDSSVKPYVQSLTMLDLESCIKLEEATFPPQERCSREKFQYRLSKCGDLCIGLFTSADTAKEPSASDNDSSTTADPLEAVTVPTSQPVYSGTPQRKQVLLGHVIATKTTNSTVHDDDMGLPDDWSSSQPGVGHRKEGRTVCIHSLAILPAFQRQGLGRLLLKSYIQRIESAGLADRIAIISHEPLVGFYEGFGFENKGQSKVQFGGGGWTDLVLEFKSS